jgi:glycosyltransferase involved in cell wall biosynthesis
MKILLSAYACEPQKGSEPMVGWNHMLEYAKAGHCVHVLTRENNRLSIERFFEERPSNHIKFYYYDLPQWLLNLKRGKRGIYLYYLIWQIGVYFLAKRLVNENKYDFIHHVTFVSIRQPSFLGFLEPPFIFGPVGGGEYSTKQLNSSLLTYRAKIVELVRDVSNRLIKYDPLMNITFKSATIVYATSNQTAACIPRRYREKTRIQLGVGLPEDTRSSSQTLKKENVEKIRILYAGQLIYWKGVHLTIMAAKQLVENGIPIELTIVGSGREETALRNLAERESLGDIIRWIPWMPREEILKLYSNYDCFLYPSMHDSGGFVVLEALSYGLPVVCLDIGGPGKIVNSSCGAAVSVDGRSVEDLVYEISNEVLKVKPRDMRTSCQKRAAEFAWHHITSKILSDAEAI